MQSNTRLIRCMTALCCEPWLLPADVHKVLTDIVEAHAEGGAREEAQHALAKSMPANPGKRQFTLQGNTAIIPVQGVIGRKFSDMLYDSGVTSSDILERMVRAAGDDDEVDSLMLVFDSPGGMAMGTPEVAAAIKSAGQKKYTVAYGDGLIGSAAYWMASQCDLIYAMTSADIGSIGAYMAILDRSRQMAMEGVKLNLFKSGKHKGMGLPGTELTREQEDMLQARINKMGADFKAAVRAGRGRNISDDVMQGQSFGAVEAKENGLIDEITSYNTALEIAAGLGKSKKRR